MDRLGDHDDLGDRAGLVRPRHLEGRLAVKRLYFAHPIDLAAGVAVVGEPAIGAIQAAAKGAGWEVMDPATAYGADVGAEMRWETNWLALENADAVLAWLPAGIPTLGTPLEIEKAVELGKPVCVVCSLSARQRSVVVAAWERRGATVTSSWDDAIRWLRGVGQVEESDGGRQGEADGGGVQVRPRATREVEVGAAREGIEVPVRGFQRLRVGRPGDAGWDLVVSEQVVVPPGAFVDVPCEVYVAWPEGYWGWIVGRSSTLRSRGLLVNQGIIDQGWRGQLMVGVWNMAARPGALSYEADRSVTIEAGERIAQVIPMAHVAAQLEPVGWAGLVRDEQSGTGWAREAWGEGSTWGDRGEEGFGSSGR